ncbi:MAG: hypothetical protein HC822_05345 [Oscillochloris sp.]|nr:hypothetical protein [Oscillochloris sp.]
MTQQPARTAVAAQAGVSGDAQRDNTMTISLLRYSGMAATADLQAGGGTLAPLSTGGTNETFLSERVAPLLATATRKHLLVLQGSAEVAVEPLLHRVAEAVAEHAGRLAGQGAPIPIRELIDPDGYPADLFTILAAATTPTVIVVDRATRRLSGWDFDRLAAAAAEHRHVLLLSSAAPMSAWRLAPAERVYWHNCGDPEIYEPSYLLTLLLSKLEAFRPLADPGIAAYIQAELPVLCRRLMHPFRVGAFGRALRERRPTTTDAVNALIDEIATLELRTMIGRWFHHELDRRGQLLALGLSLLEGIDEESALHHLDRLLQEQWKQPSGVIDRVDLRPLDPCFHMVERRPHRPILMSRFPAQRRTIVQVALPNLRRSLSHGLFYLAEHMRRSLGDADEPPGAAMRADRSEFRAAAARAFIEIGAGEPDLVEGPLLLLVADGRSLIRDRVGQILAAWYEGPSAERILFMNLVRRWLEQPRAASLIDGIRDAIDPGAIGVARDWIQAALLAACCISARGLRANEIPNELLELIHRLCMNPDPATQRAIQECVLAQLLPLHLEQLDPLLGELAATRELRMALVDRLAGLARSDDHLDQQVALLSIRWQGLAAGAVPHQDGAAPTTTDHGLIAVTEIYNALNRNGGPSSAAITLGTIRALRTARVTARHPQTREAADWSLLQLGARDPALWNELLAGFDPSRTDYYATLLRDLHMAERALINQGALELELNGRRYKVTPDADAPQTTSCQFIDYVLAMGKTDAAYQLALRAGIVMARDFDLHEAALIQAPTAPVVAAPPADPKASKAKKADPPAAEVVPTAPTYSKSGFFCDVFLPIFVTRDAPLLRPKIEVLLPYAQETPVEEVPALAYVLDQSWNRIDRGETREIAHRLAEALNLSILGSRSADVLLDIRALPTLYQALKEQKLLSMAIAALVLAIAVLSVLVLMATQIMG